MQKIEKDVVNLQSEFLSESLYFCKLDVLGTVGNAVSMFGRMLVSTRQAAEMGLPLLDSDATLSFKAAAAIV